MWIEKNKILHVNGLIPEEGRATSENVASSVSSIISSHFSSFQIVDSGDGNTINAIVPKETVTVYVEQHSYEVLPWQVFAWTNQVSASYPSDKVTVFSFPYLDEKPTFGSGSNKYRVKAIIRDEYVLEVLANSAEDAKAVASAVEIHHWDHLDIEPHLTERKLMRYARWGNFEVEDIK